MCKSFGVSPIQIDKNNEYTILSRSLRTPNQQDPEPLKEEESAYIYIWKYEIDGSRPCSTFHQADTWKLITSPQEPGRSSYTPENARWAFSEPLNVIINKDEGQMPELLKNNLPSTNGIESSKATAQWITPPDTISINGRKDMLTTSDLFQSLYYITTAFHYLTHQS